MNKYQKRDRARLKEGYRRAPGHLMAPETWRAMRHLVAAQYGKNKTQVIRRALLEAQEREGAY